MPMTFHFCRCIPPGPDLDLSTISYSSSLQLEIDNLKSNRPYPRNIISWSCNPALPRSKGASEKCTACIQPSIIPTLPQIIIHELFSPPYTPGTNLQYTVCSSLNALSFSLLQGYHRPSLIQGCTSSPSAYLVAMMSPQALHRRFSSSAPNSSTTAFTCVPKSVHTNCFSQTTPLQPRQYHRMISTAPFARGCSITTPTVSLNRTGQCGVLAGSKKMEPS